MSKLALALFLREKGSGSILFDYDYCMGKWTKDLVEKRSSLDTFNLLMALKNFLYVSGISRGKTSESGGFYEWILSLPDCARFQSGVCF